MDSKRKVTRRDFLQRLGVFGVAGLGAGSVLTACGGSEEGNSDGQSSQGAGSGTASSGGDGGQTVTLHPQGNQMKFEETEFTVPAGEKVTLVFENTASSPSMQHNVVILNESPGQEIYQKIGQAGAKAGASEEYVPDDPAILAHTPISKPGETVSVSFTTPSEPGDYGYVCTYPGHWATMQGTMHVE